jgi:hypothetical protein
MTAMMLSKVIGPNRSKQSLELIGVEKGIFKNYKVRITLGPVLSLSLSHYTYLSLSKNHSLP